MRYKEFIKRKQQLLYLYGSDEIDEIIGKYFPGEDTWLEFTYENSILIININSEHKVLLKIADIIEIIISIEEEQLIINTNQGEIFISFQGILSYSLIDLLIQIPARLNIPQYLLVRHEAFKDPDIFNIIDYAKETIKENEYIHYYDQINESGYTFIVHSLNNEQILNEIPLIYIKYVNSGEKELGCLLTNKNLYSPGNSIPIESITQITYEAEYGYPELDKLKLYINEELFTIMPLIIYERKAMNIPFHYANEFPVEDILELIIKVIKELRN